MKTIIIKTVLVILISYGSFSARAQSNVKDINSSFKVFGSCGMCKQRIEKTLKIKGIKTAVWDVDTKVLSLTYDSTIVQLDNIYEKLIAAGHDTELKKAENKTYNDLPECCHYRDAENNQATVGDVIDSLHFIRGIVLTEDEKGNFAPLSGANILFVGSKKGVSSDLHGVFSIPKEENFSQLIVSYSGYQSDTVMVRETNELQIILGTNNRLGTVKVTAKLKTMYVNTSSAFRTVNITSKELLKAACCNLSESFETNPSVDVSYNDAVTGSKQIQLLGLSGIYTQLTVESLPGPRGLATSTGLNSIAGPWIESIQLSKGTGSVVNGFESIAGQINIELKKPENSEQLYVNGYINSMGKTDVNLNMAKAVSSKWSTALLLHDDFLYNKTDVNKDGFRDLPTGNLFNAVNRWKFDNQKGVMIQLGIKVLNDNKVGGQMNFEPVNKFSTQIYGLGIQTKRYEGFAKIGYVFPEKKYQSIGLQLSAFNHQQDAYYGLTKYIGEQDNFYSNLIYQTIIGTTTHKFRTGLSLSSDKYKEDYNTQYFQRTEVVPGAFFEYTYTMNEKFTAVAGIRADKNSLFGWFATPRLNIRYEPIKGTTIRISAGRGQRTANVFAENSGLFVSSRSINIVFAEAGKAYGLDPEVAWNKGISIDQKFKLFSREATAGLDFFRNDFSNQVVVDIEDPRQAKFYNLNGKSYSNSLQAEINTSPIKNVDVRLAYRWFDVQATYSGVLLQKPFTATNRAFANIAYQYKNWKFDCTLNYIGRKRIPSTKDNPIEFRLSASSPAYFTMNAQISTVLSKNKAFEVYIGGENLNNFFQQNPIVANTKPFENYFDASLIWGPINGRQLYGGFRYSLK